MGVRLGFVWTWAGVGALRFPFVSLPDGEPGPRPRARPAACLAFALVAAALAATDARAQGQFGPFGRPQPVPKPKAPQLLDVYWPGHPEWLAMLAEIGTGGQAGPDRGWYKRNASRVRFTWPAVSARLDADGDGKIRRNEFPGTDTDYKRLDRNADEALTAVDFKFPANALERVRSRIVMGFGDRNRDSRINREEYKRMAFEAVRDELTRQLYFADSFREVTAALERSEREGNPFLTLADLRDTIDRAGVRRGLPTAPDADGDFDRADKPTLVRALVRGELGALGSGPALDAPAPDFTLTPFDGGEPVTLSKRVGAKPIVLAFGCLTSAPLRAEAGSLLRLDRRYRDRADFLFVYVRESNPVDGWLGDANQRVRFLVKQPTDLAGRAAVAKRFRTDLGLEMPILVDAMDDQVARLYSGKPSRLYLIDRQGKVAYKGGRGPFGFKPDELEQSLLLLLQAEAPASPPAP